MAIYTLKDLHLEAFDLPEYLISCLKLAGINSPEAFLALKDGSDADDDEIPISTVVSYLREQLPLLESPQQIITYLPPQLNSGRILDLVRRQAAVWDIPPGTKFLLFRAQREIRGMIVGVDELVDRAFRQRKQRGQILDSLNSPAEVPCPNNLSIPRRHQRPQTLDMNDSPAKVPGPENISIPSRQQHAQSSDMDDSPAKVPRLEPQVASIERKEGGRRHRTRKRARRSKNPAPTPIQTLANTPTLIQTLGNAPTPMQTLPVSAAPLYMEDNKSLSTVGKRAHVIFDSDGEVTEERDLSFHPHTLEVAQNRKQCKNKANFEIPEMSKKAQLNSKQTNRSFFLKNDGCVPEIPAHALRKNAQRLAKSKLDPEEKVKPPPKKKVAVCHSAKTINVDLDEDSSSSSSSSSSDSSSEAESKPHMSSGVLKATHENVTSDRPKSSNNLTNGHGPQEGSIDPNTLRSPAHNLPSLAVRENHFKSPEVNRSHLRMGEVEDEPEIRDYSVLEDISKPPEEGSLIAFKTLELDPITFTPGISDFKEGKFLAFERAKGRCKIQVLVNKRMSDGDGKFDVWIQSSDGHVLTNFEEEEEMLVTSWDALQDVKLISGPKSDS